MIYETSELEGELLNAAVAKADAVVAFGAADELRRVAAQIGVTMRKLVSDCGELQAHMRQMSDAAAMRAYVVRKFGNEVELP